MKYAILIDGKVSTIAEFDAPPTDEYIRLTGYTLAEVPEDAPVDRGDTYKDGHYYAPDGSERIAPPPPEPIVPLDLSAIMEDVSIYMPESQAADAQMAIDDAAARLAAVRVLATHTEIVPDEVALILPATIYREWTGTGMGSIAAKEIIRYGDTLYRCPNGVSAPQNHQKPGGAGMLAVYAPIRPGTEGQVLPWVYGEVLDIGAKRIDPTDGKTYEVYNPVGANIYAPHLVPAIWRLAS